MFRTNKLLILSIWFRYLNEQQNFSYQNLTFDAAFLWQLYDIMVRFKNKKYFVCISYSGIHIPNFRSLALIFLEIDALKQNREPWLCRLDCWCCSRICTLYRVGDVSFYLLLNEYYIPCY